MPIPPITLDCVYAHLLGVGILYGLGMMLALSKPPTRSPLVWKVVLIVAGYILFGLWQSFTQTVRMDSLNYPNGSVWVSDPLLCRTWTFTGLVWLCQSYENWRYRFRRRAAHDHRFTIADLMVVTTGFACMMAAVRYTSLVERDVMFWLGMLAITVILPLVVMALRIDGGVASWMRWSAAFVVAGALVIGLSWAESSVVQLGKIDFADAASRYGCLIAAMMIPRLIEQFVAAAHGLGRKSFLLPIVDCGPRPALVTDRLEIQLDAPSDKPPMPRADTRRADTAASRQAQPSFEVIA